MNIMEQVRAFIRTYPPLAGNKINVDFLPGDAGSYAVEAVPAKGIVKTYADGSTVRQFLFVLASRESYGAEVLRQLENLEFYENFSRWLETQTRSRSLPDLGEGRKALKIEASTPGYALNAETGSARYQIQCRMEFFQKRSE